MLLWEQGLLEVVEGVPEDRGHLETEGELGEEGVLQLGRGGKGLGLHHFRQDAPKVVLAILFAAAALEAGQTDPHQSIGDLYMWKDTLNMLLVCLYSQSLSFTSLPIAHLTTPLYPLTFSLFFSLLSSLLTLSPLPPSPSLPHLGEENAQVPRSGIGS